MTGQRLFRAAVATLPPRIRTIIGVRAWPGAVVMGRVVTTMLRLTLGSSISWRLALLRVGAPEPDGVTFRQTLPPRAEALRVARAAGTSGPSRTE